MILNNIVRWKTPMTILTYAIIGFIAGLFTMTIISLYRYAIKSVKK